MKAGLDVFVFSDAEKLLITAAMVELRPWDSESVAAIKQRIKNFHLRFAESMCCYCYRDLTAEFSFVIDVEHILPKRHYKPLTFDVRNLSVACKRCNMKMKRDRLDFLDLPFDESELEAGEKYKIIHPNIDYRDQHLKRVVLQFNAKRMVKYVPVGASAKGVFSYNYFQLAEFEIDSFDTAQGANQPIDEAIAAIRELVNSIN